MILFVFLFLPSLSQFSFPPSLHFPFLTSSIYNATLFTCCYCALSLYLQISLLPTRYLLLTLPFLTFLPFPLSYLCSPLPSTHSTGQDDQGRITTMGRGGSDLTATVIGSAAGVDEIQVIPIQLILSCLIVETLFLNLQSLLCRLYINLQIGTPNIFYFSSKLCLSKTPLCRISNDEILKLIYCLYNVHVCVRNRCGRT